MKQVHFRNTFQYTLLVPYFARTKYVYLSCTGICKCTVEVYIMHTLSIPTFCKGGASSSKVSTQVDKISSQENLIKLGQGQIKIKPKE